MSLPFLVSGILLLQLAGCAMGRDAQPVETVTEPAISAREQQPAIAAVPPPPATRPAGEPAPADTVPTPTIAAPPAPQKPPVPASPAPVAKPVPIVREKPAAKPPAKTAVPAPQQQKTAPPQSGPSMALATLEQRLKDTNAIGLFTKIALKNQVDDLVSRVRAHHEGNGATLSQLRQAYDELLAKVNGLLKEGDPALAGSIMASREAIWQVLTDPVKFAKL